MSALSRWFRIADYSVAGKIAMIIAIMCVPFGMMVYLYLAQVQKDVDFARSEADGLAAIEKVWGGTLSLGGGQSRTNPADLATVLKDRIALWDTQFKAGAAVAAMADVLRSPKVPADALDTAKTAIQKLADGSNLTLDPDVDSFYLMDAVTVRMPELVAATAGLRDAAAVYFDPKAKPSASDFVAYVRAHARFDLAVDPIGSDIESSIGGNTDGTVGKALTSALQRFRQQAEALGKHAKAISAAVEDGKSAAGVRDEFVRADAALLAETASLWSSTAGELRRLLEARVDRMRTDSYIKMLVVAFCLLLTAGMTIYVVRSVRGPIFDLVGALRRFRSGEYQFVVPHAELNNEIGEIAKALRRFQEMASQQALTMAALDGSSTMLMITDPEERVVFMSGALIDQFMKFEPSFRAVRHDFSIEKMMGQHVDYYCSEPQIKRELLHDDGKTRKVRMSVDGQTIIVDMSYIYGNDGSRVGHTLLWHNMTAELESQTEVGAVVAAAVRGDFSGRLSLDGKTGFVREIASGLNTVSQNIERAVDDFTDVLGAVSSGDLTRAVDGDYEGKLGALKSAVEETIARLSDTVVTIQTTAVDVGTAAREINSGADDLSRRTEEQASSLEQTAATTEELAASVKASAQASRHAVELAEEAMGVAVNGGSIVSQAVQAMARIEEASQKITDITSVIDEIAFQTNLLALNAAVEAARAGDAGKGFAVVASEVRTLAQRSSEAAKDITGLIGTSTAEVTQGVKLVRAAGEALQQIVGASKKVASTVSEVSSASSEQANGIDEMTQAVAHMDEMTQQNAALAEESAASAGALSGQIERLNELVATFRTRQGGYPAARGGDTDRLRRLAQESLAEEPRRRRA